MCDVLGKLIAWLDRELSPDEAAAVSRHIKGCQECRGRLAAYKQVSETFDVYCDAVVAAKTRRPGLQWAPVLASAVVAVVVMFLVWPPKRIDLPPVLTPTITAASVPVPTRHSAESVQRKKMRRRHVAPPVQEPPVRKRPVQWQSTETAVQIAIPAEAMLPPGAMPNGMNFIAELSIAPDGSVQQVRLRQ